MVLRLLTLNTHKGFSWLNRRFVLHELRQAIRDTWADIVFLQEVAGENAKRARRHYDWPQEPQHQFLAHMVWSDQAYGRNVVYPHGHHGNAILSRYRILNSERMDISTNRFEPRGVLHCCMELPGQAQALHCICVHLGLFAHSRRKQFTMLMDYVSRRIPERAPLAIAGDFNDWTGRANGRFAASLALEEAAVATRGRTARTYPSWLPVLPLDRIYFRGLKALRSHTCSGGSWSGLSDHAGLLAEVELDRPPGAGR
jgi:endonuclease/exonuclease/phosphatase family metal-dependent hydrolase